MTLAALDRAARAAGARVVAALAARYRDLDLAEDGFAEACARAAELWPRAGPPGDPAAWLYRIADRAVLDALRRRRTRERLVPEPPVPEPTAEDLLADDIDLIPDERLRLIFVCCHPAVAPEARAALTLRLVCGLTTTEIARAFLVAEPTLAQRLVRAKRKIAEAGVPFEIPRPEAWPERLDAVLSTLEIAYAKAHEDAAGAGPHAGYADEMLELTRVLAELLPDEPEVLGLAALVCLSEARRPARRTADGGFVPLGEQDTTLWDTVLVARGEELLRRAHDHRRPGRFQYEAAIQSAHCARATQGKVDLSALQRVHRALLRVAPSLGAAVASAAVDGEIDGPDAGLRALDVIGDPAVERFQPALTTRAHLLFEAGRATEAADAYRRAIELTDDPGVADYLLRCLRLATG